MQRDLSIHIAATCFSADFASFCNFSLFFYRSLSSGRGRAGEEKLFYYLSYFCRLSEVNFVCCLLRARSLFPRRRLGVALQIYETLIR